MSAGTPGGRQQQGTLLELVRAAESGPRSLDSVRERIKRTHRLSSGYLGIGFLVMALLLVVRGVVSFLWSLDAQSATWLTGAAWALVITALAGGVVVAVSRHGELRPLDFAVVSAVDVVALGLEFADYALPSPAASYYPSVCVGVGATVLALLAYQPLSRSSAAIALLIGLSALGLAGQALIGHGGTGIGGLGIGVGNALLAIAPVAVCASMLTALDRHVHRKLDRTVADSVIDGPSTAAGSLAASQLSEVDAVVERLLGELVEGTAALDDESAERARVLGDELRAALARSHDETWLRIAVRESALLSEAVDLDDPHGLAAALPPPDRSRLLSVLWLLTAQTAAARTPVRLVLSRAPAAPLALALSASGVRPRDLDAAVWGLLSELGDYRVSVEGSTTHVRLRRPAERRSTA